jgi:hypothetical protein
MVRRARSKKATRGFDAVKKRHPNVHEHHVRLQLTRELHCLLAVGGLAYFLDVRVWEQDQA